MKYTQNKYFWIIFMVFIVAISRLLPHPWNFTPVTAMFLFSGAKLERNFRNFFIPLAALFLSDVLINSIIYHGEFSRIFYDGFQYIYLAYFIIYFFNNIFKPQLNSRLIVYSFISSIIFFLVTNFAAWIHDPMYVKSIAGLLSSYAAGIPFFRNAILGDLVYGFAIFYTFHLVEIKLLKKEYVR